MGALKVYEWRGGLWQWREGEQPDDAVEHGAKASPAARAKQSPANKGRSRSKAPANKAAK